MSEIMIDLQDYHRMVNRAHYRCGHSADFKVGPPPQPGDWMICGRCLQETYVERVEMGVKLPRRGHGPHQND